MTETPDTGSESARTKGLLEGPRVAQAALAAAAVALVVAVVPWFTGGPSDGQIRRYLLEHPEMLQEMSAALQVKADNDRTATINQRAAANPQLLAVDARDPAFGPADARVTVIEFFDFRCPGCKATAPEVLRLMQAHPDVRFVFKDWPILDRPGEDVSHMAARAAQAAHRQGKYLPVFRAMMAEPALDEAAIARILSENGVSLPQAQEAMASADVARHLGDIHTAAAALSLSGTPTFFINGTASPSIQPADIDRAIRAAKG